MAPQPRLSDGDEGHAYDQHGADRHIHSKSIDNVLEGLEYMTMQGFVRRGGGNHWTVLSLGSDECTSLMQLS